MNSIKKVEIFASGTWNGFKFIDDDLLELSENTNMLITSKRLKAPFKFGHDDKQIIDQEDGQPALGWIERVYTAGGKLLADFVNVPDVVMRAIEKKLYRQVSAELRFFEHIGWSVTAVALLGADLPAVKVLEDLDKFLSEDLPAFQVLSSDLVETGLLSFSEPILKNDKHEVKIMDEIEKLKAQLAEANAKIEEGKKLESERAFAEAKSATLAKYKELVTAGKMQPAAIEKIEVHLDGQKEAFSEGKGLAISADLSLDLVQNFTALPNTETAKHVSTEGTPDEIDFADEILEKEIANVMLNGMNYSQALERVTQAKPEIVKNYNKLIEKMRG